MGAKDLEHEMGSYASKSAESSPRRSSSRSPTGSPNQKSRSFVRKEKKSQFMRRKSTLKDARPPIDKFVDGYWRRNLDEPRDAEARTSVGEIDLAVHKLIHEMLVMAEDDPQLKNAVHLKESMIQHQELIMAVKEAIKPGLFSIYFQRFTKDMLKTYFARL